MSAGPPASISSEKIFLMIVPLAFGKLSGMSNGIMDIVPLNIKKTAITMVLILLNNP
jgi:hypothetical protein